MQSVQLRAARRTVRHPAPEVARHARSGARRGATLIELLVVLALSSVLLGLGVPSLRGLVNRAAVTSASAEVGAALAVARAAAIARGARTRVEIDTARGALAVLTDGDAARPETLRVVAPLREQRVRLAATRTRLAYESTGMGYGASNTSIIVTRGGEADTVVVSRLGRVRH